MQIIVFAPHPDDDLIGCGGTMARHLQQGHKVSVVYMSSGDAGSLKHGKRKMTQIREEEAQNAADLLGISDLHFFRNPDGYIEFNRDNIIKLVSLIRDIKPDSVYIPHHLDAVRDHVITHELVVEACRRAAGPWFQECEGTPWSVDNILAYEVGTPLQAISCVENISQFIQVKLDALQLHRSQIEAIRYDEAVKALNRFRGIMSGQGDYCECFELIKTRIPYQRN
ncbi:MAG: PIG-L family deacetylase [Syntrophomonadaceae bacterium]|nr:PIG-L family deacetylase [Syntrophomonadaceae bacterium]MDD3023154.1 PIG-L family deacetylase [Syntrophomonadaceae bacterium]